MKYSGLPDPARHISWLLILSQVTTGFAIPLMNNSDTSTNFLGITKPNIGIVIPDQLYRCSWSSCGQECGGGLTETFRDTTGCPQDASGSLSFRKFCCPGQQTSCRPSVVGMDDTACYAGGCDASEILAATTQYNPSSNTICPSGNVNICCQHSQSIDNTIGECKWVGDAPNCAPDGKSAECPAGLHKITTSLRGDGGSQVCATGRRSLCCPEKPHFNPATCAWHSNRIRDTCSPGCPQDQLMLSVDSAEMNCQNGLASFCCAPNGVDRNGQLEDWLTDFRAAVKDFVAGNNCQNPTSKSKRLVSDSMARILYPYLSLDIHVEDGSTYLNQASSVWDEETGPYGEEFPSFTHLIDDIRPSPGAEIPIVPSRETEDHLAELVCTADQATDLQQQKKRFATQVCVQHGASGAPALQKRRFLDLYIEGGPYVNNRAARSVQTVLWHLVRNHLQFQYFRWFRYTQGQNAREVELEMTFLLGPDATQILPQLQQDPRDRYVVIHMHMNPILGQDGVMEIAQINMRHGRTMDVSPPLAPLAQNTWEDLFGRYRANTQAENGGTPILECPINFNRPDFPDMETTTGVNIMTVATTPQQGDRAHAQSLREFFGYLRYNWSHLFAGWNNDPSIQARDLQWPENRYFTADGQQRMLMTQTTGPNGAQLVQWADGVPFESASFDATGNLYHP